MRTVCICVSYGALFYSAYVEGLFRDLHKTILQLDLCKRLTYMDRIGDDGSVDGIEIVQIFHDTLKKYKCIQFLC